MTDGGKPKWLARMAEEDLFLAITWLLLDCFPFVLQVSHSLFLLYPSWRRKLFDRTVCFRD